MYSKNTLWIDYFKIQVRLGIFRVGSMRSRTNYHV